MSDSESSDSDDSDVYQPSRPRGKDKQPPLTRAIQTRSSVSSPSTAVAIDLNVRPTSSSKRRSRHRKNILDFPSVDPGIMPNDASPSPAGSSPVHIPSSSVPPIIDLSYSPTTSKPPARTLSHDSPTPSLTSLTNPLADDPAEHPARLFTQSAQTLNLYIEDLETSMKKYHSTRFDAVALLSDYGIHHGLLRERTADFQAGLLAVLVRWETPHVEGFWLVSLKEELTSFCVHPPCPEVQPTAHAVRTMH
ncbi:hypothetical protein PLEOSDRAFT_162284 [Pleurotus ostreatus PC15]|uniref:Uncharacterized protein n=1 Tax=Pleurotus ostreatus (strain PC15) TaxID=1137138 RepID=A0A067NIV9_PLEO1|nr:hypothetical protein PLEOSDRAFT_162284 [Pleurotus ostreatus PC15]